MNDCEEDALPEQVLKGDKVPLVEIVGVAVVCDFGLLVADEIL